MLFPIKLQKNKDGSVTGILPSGEACTWANHLSNKPTKRNKKVMVNCWYWKAEWCA